MNDARISPAVLSELERQLTHEMQASQAYLGMSLWCLANTYPGFAAFFEKQSLEEREHALKLMKHLVDRGAVPHIGNVAAPKVDFAAVLETAELSQKLERQNTAGIHQAYEAALAAKDYAATVVLQWFIEEQVEEEAWTDDLVERVRRSNCAGAMANLDRHVVKLLSGED